jgi:flagella basal body P-ring formation protein FlgA
MLTLAYIATALANDPTEVVEHAIAERMGITPEDIEIQSLGIANAPPNADWNVTLPTGNLWGTVALQLNATLPTGEVRRYSAYAHISIWAPIPIATTETAPGQPIQITMERRNLDSLKGGSPVDPQHNWRARSTLHAGDPVTLTRAAPLPDANKGQPVEIWVQHGALQIRAPGQLNADAFTGQPVTVLNLATQTVVTGIYQPDGRVRLGAAP